MLINLLIIFYLELVMNMKDFFESEISLFESAKRGKKPYRAQRFLQSDKIKY